MLHWEDFGASNARRILNKYADQVLHLQRRHARHRGRGAGRRVRPRCAPPAPGMRDQRVVIYGAGTAGIGIADLMRDAMIREGLSPAGSHPRGSGPLDSQGLLDRRLRRTCGTSSCPTPAPATRSPAGPRDQDGRSASPRSSPSAPDHADRHLHPGRRVHRSASSGDMAAHTSIGRSSCRCPTPRPRPRPCRRT